MPAPFTNTTALDLAGVLAYLSGWRTGPMPGPAAAANAAWGAINSNGAKAAGIAGSSMISALNQKNGSVGLDINLVCNQLAGTVGLEADLALRTYAGLA